MQSIRKRSGGAEEPPVFPINEADSDMAKPDTIFNF